MKTTLPIPRIIQIKQHRFDKQRSNRVFLGQITKHRIIDGVSLTDSSILLGREKEKSVVQGSHKG